MEVPYQSLSQVDQVFHPANKPNYVKHHPDGLTVHPVEGQEGNWTVSKQLTICPESEDLFIVIDGPLFSNSGVAGGG